MKIRKTIGVVLFAALSGMTTLAAAQEQIVYIDGVKYRIHVVNKGETLYSLSKNYGLSIEELIEYNPVLKEGLKAGQTLKVPHNDKGAKGEKFSKKKFDIHIVKWGETLYSIARRYQISLDTLIADNGNLDPTKLSAGQKLHIRKSEVGQTDVNEVQTELQQHTEMMNKVAGSNDYSYHVIHRGETVTDIGKRFDASEQDILKLNGLNSSEEIREGSIIKVPRTPIFDSTASDSSQTDYATEELPIAFNALDASKRAKVSLLLPLTANGQPAVNYIDFYQGFLLGADDVRREGYSVNVRLHDTAHDHLRINGIIENGELDLADLIVGPVYEDELIPVVNNAERKSIPVVSPLAAIDNISSGVAFQMSPDADAKLEKVRYLFDGSRRIVMITTDGTDKEFEAEVAQLLGEMPYQTHHYIYEHPSLLAKRDENAPPSPGDLSPLLQSEDPRETVFLIMADKETDVDRILAALASAHISLAARSQRVSPYKVLGNTRWNRYRNIDKALFFADNVIMLSSYHARRDNPKVREFDSRYAEAFGAIPSLYSYRGYDAAWIFIRALYGDGIDKSMESGIWYPLQTPYLMDTDADSKTYVNREWVKVNYNRDFTITVE